MNNKNLIIICITAIIIAAIVAGAAYMIMDKQISKEQKNITQNNTTKIANNTTVEKISNDNKDVKSDSQSNNNKHASGLSDDEIEANIERDVAIRTANGVKTPYDYEEARSFYENVPKEGMR